MPRKLPGKEGLYFARQRRFRWWNLIVSVVGDVPFLMVDAVWNYRDRTLIVDPRAYYEIEEFGPQIEAPPDPVLPPDEKK